ncbi:glycosyltransferase family 2 protein [Aeromonas caviae]|uniref:glycosyltransferase family 2 protein n=1 Tax=Aeromonas caviae TaxID=648 RepID=UPI0038D05297
MLNSISIAIEEMITEDEVKRNWSKEGVLVSVICTAYNHESYICNAINSFILQETTFPFEIIINDDKSTDSTLDILSLYKRKYPNIIKLISHECNQYSLNISPYKFIHELASGKYLALCEGDDFWNTRDKLAIQFDILEANPNSDLCIHSAYILESDKTTDKDSWNYRKQYYSLRDVFESPGQFAPTSSYFFRKSLIEGNEVFRTIYFQAGIIDFFIEVFSANNDKKIIAINRKLSTYRVQAAGSWTEANLKNFLLKVQNTRKFVYNIKCASSQFNHKYKHLFSRKISEEIQDCIVVGVKNREYLKVAIFSLKNIFELNLIRLLGRAITKVMS